MKRMNLSVLFLACALTIARAQARTGHRFSKTNVAAAKSRDTVKHNVADTVQLNNRDIYEWTNGQQSTLTGKEATSSNGSAYATLNKDTSKLVRTGKTKQ